MTCQCAGQFVGNDGYVHDDRNCTHARKRTQEQIAVVIGMSEGCDSAMSAESLSMAKGRVLGTLTRWRSLPIGLLSPWGVMTGITH
jgi:hypothetical protein